MITAINRPALRARLALISIWTAYVLVLAGVATSALTLVNFAGGDAGLGSVIAGATAALFGCAAILFWVDKRLENDPALRRDVERGRRVKYLGAYRRSSS